MTLEDICRKQVIIPMRINNIKRIMAQSNTYIVNINRLLKDIKLEVSVDFIRFDNKDIIATTNKVAIMSDLNVIEEYVRNLNDMDSSDIMSPRLFQLKSYLNILNILYFIENTNISITVDIVKRVIQTTYIFNDVVLTSCSHIIKASSKSDMAII